MQRVICTYVHSIKKSSVPLYIYEVKLNTDALGHEMYVKLYIDRLRSKLVCVFSLARQLNVQSKGSIEISVQQKKLTKKESERTGGDELNWSSGRKLQPTSWDTLYAQNVNLYHKGYINVYNVLIYISRKVKNKGIHFAP